MADDLSLLFKIRGDAAGAKAATAETRAAVAQLRTSLGGEFSQMQKAGESALAGIGNGLNVFVGQRLPLVGGAFLRVTENLKGMTGAAEESGSAFAALGGPIGIAVIAVGAMVAGSAVLIKTFADLTVSTAEWQGALEDLSQQTGVSVETLSALEVAAKTTGGNLEQLTASLGIFQKNLEAAQDPTTKQAAAFKKLGVDTQDTEQALRETLKALEAMPEGFEQTAAALEVFGRGGKSFLAIAKETNGDLDLLTNKLKELGIVVSGEDAKAADAFNDQLALIQFQIRATTALLVKDALPDILSALKEVSSLVKDNRELFLAFGAAVRDEVKADTFLLWGFVAAVRAVNSALGIGPSKLAADAQGGLGGINALKGLTGGVTSGGPGDPGTGGGGGGGGDPLAKFQSILNSTINALDQYGHKSEFVRVQDQLTAAGLGQLTGKLKEQAEQLAQTALANARLVDSKRDLTKLEEEKKKSDQEVLDMIGQQAENIYEARGLTDQYKIAIDHLIASLNGYTPAEKEAVRATLEKNAALEKTLALTRQRIVLEQTLIDRLERQRAVTTEVQDRLLGIDHAGGDETRGRTVKPVLDASNEIGKLFNDINKNLSGAKKSAAVAGVEALTGAFSGLGDAIGQAAQAWVLYGNAGASVQKVVAQILAGVAQQAAVKAIFEAAEGLAALARAFFGDPTAAAEATLHFQAAATYGAVAGVAAVAGRGVAGNSFVQGGSAGATTASSGSTGGGGSTQSAPPPIVQGSQRMEVIHKIVPPPGWGHTVLVSALNSNDPEINRAIGRERG